MKETPKRIYRVILENDSYVHLCDRHLKQWRADGGHEPAHVAKGLEAPGDCDYCQAALIKAKDGPLSW